MFKSKQNIASILFFVLSFYTTESFGVVSSKQTICNWLEAQDIDVSGINFEEFISDRHVAIGEVALKFKGTCQEDEREGVSMTIYYHSGGRGYRSSSYSTSYQEYRIYFPAVSNVIFNETSRKTYYTVTPRSSNLKVETKTRVEFKNIIYEFDNNKFILHAKKGSAAASTTQRHVDHSGKVTLKPVIESDFLMNLSINLNLKDRTVRVSDPRNYPYTGTLYHWN